MPDIATGAPVDQEELVPLRRIDQTHDEEKNGRIVPKEPKEPSEPEHDDSGIHLKKELGLLDGMGIIIGIIIGSGIFISPTGVIKYTGSVGMSLTIWLTAGLLTIMGAMCYAELGTMIPKSGGDYAYIFAAFGDFPAFLYMWVVMVIILPTRNAIVALTFANYIILPAFPNCTIAPEIAVKLVAALVICLLTWINCVNVKAATKIQDIFTVTKVFALVLIILAGAYHLFTGHTENFVQPFENTNWSVSALATSFYQGLFSYAGWNYLNYIVEELKDPYKNLPRAIILSLPTVTVIYFLTNVAYFAVLTPEEVLASNAVAVTFGNRMFGYMAWIIPFFVACSTFGGLNGGIFASSRLFFVGARQGHLPQALALINIHALTPKPALIFLASITMVMLSFSDITALINYISFTESIFILTSITGLLWMRYKHPDLPRPIKIWIVFPIFFWLICLFLVILPLAENPLELLTAIAIVLAGIPVYFIFIFWKSKPKFVGRFFNKFTSGVQILTLGLIEEKVE